MDSILQAALASGKLWTLAEPDHPEGIVLPSSTEPERYMPLFWTAPEHATTVSVELELESFEQGLSPLEVRLATVRRNCLLWHKQGRLVGLSDSAVLCELEAEPLAVLGRLAELEARRMAVPAELQDELRQAMERAPRRPGGADPGCGSL